MLSDDIEAAISTDNGSLLLHYQPLKKLPDLDRPPLFFEALVRMKSGKKIIPASNFITAVLHNPPLAMKLDEWVLRSVAAQMRTDEFRYAVNVTPASLHQPEFLHLVKDIFEDIPKNRLVIEVIETHQLHEEAIACVKALNERFCTYLDDVGEGWSNLRAIANLSVSGLKIHGRYISNMSAYQKHRAIVGGVFDICRNIQLECVCEWVETPLEVEAVSLMAAHYPFLKLYLQGYEIGRPEAR